MFGKHMMVLWVEKKNEIIWEYHEMKFKRTFYLERKIYLLR